MYVFSFIWCSLKRAQWGWHPLYILTYGSVVSVHQVNLVLRLAHAENTLPHSCISLCNLKGGKKNSCGSFLDRSLHTSVTTYCSCSLRALLRMCHCVSAAWNARNFQPSTLANIRKHYAKYAKFLASTWNTPKTVMCRGCHHINGNRICKIFI